MGQALSLTLSVISLIPHNNHARQVILLFPFYTCGNRFKKASNLIKIMQLVNME